MGSSVNADATMTLTIQAQDEAEGILNGFEGSLDAIRSVVGAAGIAATAAFASSIDPTSHYGDVLDRIAFMTGETANQSARLLAGFGGAGIGADQAAGMVQRLQMRLGLMADQAANAGAKGNAATRMFQELGVATKDAHGHAIPLTDLMPTIIDRLGQMPSATERARISAQLFGRSYGDIAALVAQGGQGFKDAMNDANAFGLTIGEKGVDETRKFGTEQERMKESFLGLQMQLGLYILPMLSSLFEHISSLFAAFQSLSPALRETIVHLAGLAGLFGTLIGGAAVMQHALGEVTKFLGPLGDLIEGVGKRFLGLAGPVGIIIAVFLALKYAYDHVAIVHQILLPLVDKLQQVLHALSDAWGVLTGILQNGGSAWDAIRSAIVQVMDDLGAGQGQITTFEQMFQGLQSAVQPVADALGRVGPALSAFVTALQHGNGPLTALYDLLTKMGAPAMQTADAMGGLLNAFNVVKGAVESAINAIKPVLSGLGESLQPLTQTLLPALKRAWTDLQPVFAQLSPIIQQIGNYLKGMGMVVGAVAVVFAAVLIPIINGLVRAFVAVLPDAIHFVVLAFTQIMNIVHLVVDVISGLVTIVADLLHGDWAGAWQAAKDLVSNVGRDLLNIVKTLFDGIGTLFHGAFQLILGFVTGFVSGIVGFFKWLFDQLVGHSIVTDLVNGIVNLFKSLPGKVLSALGNLGQNLLNLFRSAIQGLVSLGGFIGTIGGQLGGLLVSGITGAIGGLGGLIQNAIRGVEGHLPGPVQSALHAVGLQHGAYIQASPGGTFANVGEGGEDEVVAPVSKLVRAGMAAAGGGDITVQVILDGRMIQEQVFQRGQQRARLQGARFGSSA